MRIDHEACTLLYLGFSLATLTVETGNLQRTHGLGFKGFRVFAADSAAHPIGAEDPFVAETPKTLTQGTTTGPMSRRSKETLDEDP